MTTNIQKEKRTILPIETVYFLEDVANKVCTVNGVQTLQPIYDPAHWNRYYFNYPPEWKTTNNTDPIIGVRSIWVMNNKRKISFILCMRKYSKWHFITELKELYPNRFHNVQNPVQLAEHHLTDEEIDNVVKNMEIFLLSKCHIAIECELSYNENFNKLSKYIIECWKKVIKAVNDDNYGEMFLTNPHFVQESIDVKYGEKNADLQVIDSYNDNMFSVRFTSPRNDFFFDDNSDPELESYVDFAIVPTMDTFYLRYNKDFQLKEENQQLPLDPEFDSFDNDFMEAFNVGDEIYQNQLDYITRFHRNLEFKNLWDRNTCKVCASFANQSNHYYVGNSHVRFEPIKYYRLNSSDDKFWIEFYNGRNPNIPVKLPKHEGFVIEMQFMQDDKLLYI